MNRRERRKKRAEERRALVSPPTVRPGMYVFDDQNMGIKTAFEGPSGSRTVTIVSRPMGGPAYIVVDAREAKAWTDALDHNGVWRDVVLVNGGETAEETRINLPFCLALALEELARRDAFEPTLLGDLLQAWPEPSLATVLDLGGHDRLFKVVREWLAEAFPLSADVERARMAALLVCKPEYAPALPPKSVNKIASKDPKNDLWYADYDYTRSGRFVGKSGRPPMLLDVSLPPSIGRLQCTGAPDCPCCALMKKMKS